MSHSRKIQIEFTLLELKVLRDCILSAMVADPDPDFIDYLPVSQKPIWRSALVRLDECTANAYCDLTNPAHEDDCPASDGARCTCGADR